MKFAIIGRTETLIKSAELLIENGHELVLVVTCKAPIEYRYYHEEFEAFATKMGCKYLYAPKFTEEVIKNIPVDIDIAISINYVSLVPESAVNCFRLGILNSHTGDLPRFRGNAVGPWAIINKEKYVVSCIHKMVGNSLDSGDIVVKSKMDLFLSTKIIDIWVWFRKITPIDFLSAVTKMQGDETYYLEKQSKLPKDILRCYPRMPEDAQIFWNKPNEDVVRLINASGNPYDGAFTFFKGEKLYILDAEVLNDDERFLGIPGQVSKINSDGTIEVLTGCNKIKISKVKTVNQEEHLPSKLIKSIRDRFLTFL